MSMRIVGHFSGGESISNQVNREYGLDANVELYSGTGESSGVGTNCIEDPETGECGCEDSNGTFVPGSSSCT